MSPKEKNESVFGQDIMKVWQRCMTYCILLAILFSGILSAQGRQDWAFEHVKKVQERNTKFLMSKKHPFHAYAAWIKHKILRQGLYCTWSVVEFYLDLLLPCVDL